MPHPYRFLIILEDGRVEGTNDEEFAALALEWAEGVIDIEQNTCSGEPIPEADPSDYEDDF